MFALNFLMPCIKSCDSRGKNHRPILNESECSLSIVCTSSNLLNHKRLPVTVRIKYFKIFFHFLCILVTKNKAQIPISHIVDTA